MQNFKVRLETRSAREKKKNKHISLLSSCLCLNNIWYSSIKQKSLNEVGLMILATFFWWRHWSFGIPCSLVDKQKNMLQKQSRDTSSARHFSELVEEAAFLQHTQSRGKHKGNSMEPYSQRHINCIAWFRFSSKKNKKMMRVVNMIVSCLPVNVVPLPASTMQFFQ